MTVPHVPFSSEWAVKGRQAPAAGWLAQAIGRRAAGSPGHPAIVTPATTLTWLEFASRVWDEVLELRNEALPQASPVILHMSLCPEFMVLAAACMLTGLVPAPVDPLLPADEQERLFRDTPPALMITGQARTRPSWADSTTTETMRRGKAAFIVRTSGTANHGQAVVYTHPGLADLRPGTGEDRVGVCDVVGVYGLVSGTRVLGDLLISWLTGATTALLGSESTESALAAAVNGLAVTRLAVTPTVWRTIFEEPGFVGGTALRQVVLRGSDPSPSLWRQTLIELPGSELHNVYGVSESLSGVQWRSGSPGQEHTLVPIGRIDGPVHVVDGQGQPAAPGRVGDIHIGGKRHAMGYLREGRLDPLPLVRLTDISPDPLYRTGDMGVVHEEGWIEYRGRESGDPDRLGLVDLERTASLLPGIRDVVVAASATEVTMFYSVDPTGHTDPGQLCAVFAARVSRPTTHHRLNRMPLLPSGKPDVRLLRDWLSRSPGEVSGGH